MNSSPAQPFAAIQGVQTVPLQPFGDERGRFMETFRVEWFPGVNWERLQSNRSDSSAGVLRGLHYHFKQSRLLARAPRSHPRRSGRSAPFFTDLSERRLAGYGRR